MVSRTAVLIVGVLLGCLPGSADASGDAIEFFERKVRPLLAKHCYQCHASDAKTIHGGLRLDSTAGLHRGGDSGTLWVAGEPQESLLVQVLHGENDLQMPPEGPLAQHEIDVLTRWVAAGAVMPAPSETPSELADEIDFERGREFWSFRPVRRHDAPPVSHPNWPQTRIDSFVLAAMERQGLTPSEPADRATLLRRLSFDLLGVPPTPAEVQAFVEDRSPQAVARMVDRLLESPLYGEHWGRWWLDLARYTDRTASWLYQTGKSHLYRDWVVQAFNEDMPYDQFVRRQLATDLMESTGPEDLPALGFVSLSPTYWKELKLPCEIIKVIVADEWEERVDAVSRTFLGLTVACARCHDHKYDPISSEDYYALAGVFASCRQVERPLIAEREYEPVRHAKQRVAAWEAEIAQLKKKSPRPEQQIAELTAKIEETKQNTPRYDTPMANALSEESMYVVRAGKTPQDGTRLEYRPEPRDLPAFIRGNPNRPGPIVPRRFLTVLSSDPQPYTQGSGRLELADSIVNEAQALAARVLVNRVWLAHFGRGIVATPSNFGTQGSPPSHPELLDDLAARFIAGGWSLKTLHREILLSATWQQSSFADPERVETDPENRWLSRMTPRRLTYEQWRDAMLVCGGEIDQTMGGASVDLEHPDNRRRTLYATVHRREMSPTLMMHDFPDPTQHSPARNTTVTALQGLYALNSPLLLSQAQTLAERILREAGSQEHERIGYAYRLLYSRPPTGREIDLGLAFLGASSPANASVADPSGVKSSAADAANDVARWQQYAHALLAANEFLFVE